MESLYTPLRYPGGKTKLYPLVSSILRSNNLLGCTYVEPFAGGAGLALKLLFEGLVEEIVINDFDFSIYCIWDSIVNHSQEFCDFINNVPLSVIEWQYQKDIFTSQNSHSNLEIGQAAFYLNRTNVSGVLKGGIIGGLSQVGNYRIDARFNRSSLADKVLRIGEMKGRIGVFNWDAKDFITRILPNYSHTFIYCDPPYVKKGRMLYKNAFSESDHRELCDTIIASNEQWIVTYDDCPLIRQLYAGFEYEALSINYSAGLTKQGNEILIYSPSISKIEST